MELRGSNCRKLPFEWAQNGRWRWRFRRESSLKLWIVKLSNREKCLQSFVMLNMIKVIRKCTCGHSGVVTNTPNGTGAVQRWTQPARHSVVRNCVYRHSDHLSIIAVRIIRTRTSQLKLPLHVAVLNCHAALYSQYIISSPQRRWINSIA